MTHSAADTMPDTPCYLNGEFSTLRNAKISVLDRGFLFGDGVYEVIPAYAGTLFKFAQHMSRLDRSLAELRIANPLTHAQWHATALELIANYPSATGADATCGNHLIYIQVTRGVAMRDHPMPPGLLPTVFVMVNPMKLPSADQRARGVACVSAADFRWEKAHIKSTSLLGAVFSRQISVDAGAFETVMYRGDYLSEAAASNVWLVRDKKVVGPLPDNLVLEGIRYGLIESLCRAQKIAFELRPIAWTEVLAADELLLSSASKEILPVTLLDGQPVGSGVPGPVYDALYAAYQQAKQEPSP